MNLHSTPASDKVISKMVDVDGMDGVNVVYGDESLSRLYEKSEISSEQLQSRPGIVKRAVALGRYLQNPLAMTATLCGPGKEILSWKLGLVSFFC